MNRVLIEIPDMHISHYQLLAVACMWISSKYEDANTPNIRYWLALSANTYTIDQLLEMEKTVLDVTKFSIPLKTMYDELKDMLHGKPESVVDFAVYALDMFLIDYSCMNMCRQTLIKSIIMAAECAHIGGPSAYEPGQRSAWDTYCDLLLLKCHHRDVFRHILKKNNKVCPSYGLDL